MYSVSVQQGDPGPARDSHGLARLVRYLAIPAGALLILAAALLVIRPSLPERRPVVLTVYCASSVAWVTTLAPFLDTSTSADGQHQKARVTAARIKSAYERRCAAPD